jgi:hypothetical protein
MIRYFLAKGDRAGSATIVEGLDAVTCSNPPPRVQIATLGMATYCSACKQMGSIAPMGPRRPGNAPNGKQWALSGDVNICGCRPSPVFHAQRNMMVTLTSQEVAAWMGGGDGTSAAATMTAPARANSTPTVKQYDEQLQFVTPSGTPLANLGYRIVLEDGSEHAGTTDNEGLTERIYTDGKTRMVRASLYLDGESWRSTE